MGQKEKQKIQSINQSKSRLSGVFNFLDLGKKKELFAAAEEQFNSSLCWDHF